MRFAAVTRWIIVLAVGGLLLTACGGAAPTPAPTPSPLPPVTLDPAANAIFVEGCVTGDLENWVERVDFLLRDFVSQLNLAQGQSPDQVRATLQRMVPIRDALVAISAPDGCAGTPTVCCCRCSIPPSFGSSRMRTARGGDLARPGRCGSDAR